jgi:hypothetical protein
VFAGIVLSMSEVMALSKSYPFEARASSSSDGGSVAPNTELRTSIGVIPSVNIAAASGSISPGSFPFPFVWETWRIGGER